MVTIRSVKRWFALGIAVLSSSHVYALDGFSRACRFDTIPVALQGPAALLFYLLGAPASTATLNLLPGADRYWIFESITSDYGQVRYYLHAEASIYRWSPPFPPTGWRGDYVLSAGYTSGLFKAQEPAESILGHSKLDMFFSNRGSLYSARAGRPDIYTVQPTMQAPDTYRVLGYHRYWNPAMQKAGVLDKSIATDCNLTNWGFGYR